MSENTIVVRKEEFKNINRRLDKLEIMESMLLDQLPEVKKALSDWNKENSLECVYDDFVNNIQQIVAECIEYDFTAGVEGGISARLSDDGENMVKCMFKIFLRKSKEADKE